MEMKCPQCSAVFEVGDRHHYSMIKCPKCGTEFQALGKETVQLTREYLERQKKEREERKD